MRDSLRRIDLFLTMVSSTTACSLCVLAIIASCTGIRTTKQPIPQNFILQGIVYNENGAAPSCRMSCLSVSGLLKDGEPDLRTGHYKLSLSADQANALHRFRFIRDNGDTSYIAFDQQQLRDSIINLDFRLTTMPRNYVVVTSSAVHQPSADVTDTIWLDLNGKRVSKAVSDSLWRNIPHK